MPFPKKFRHLVERTPADVDAPHYVWLTYAVCAMTAESCGWEGWMLEAAFRRDGQPHPTSTGDLALPAADEQRCPRCGRKTFRTEVSLRLEPSADQRQPLTRGVDYEVPPTEFEDE